MAGERGRFDSFTAFLVVACLALAGLVIALTIQNRSLKEQLAHAPAMGAPPQFKAGDQVSPFEVVADSGEKSTIGFGQGEAKTVLLVFSAHCPACNETLPIWSRMLATPPAQGVRVIGVQTDRLDENPAAPLQLAASFPFPVYGYKRPKPDPLSKVPFIPAAIVIDAQGVVVDAWFGIPEKDVEQALEKALRG